MAPPVHQHDAIVAPSSWFSWSSEFYAPHGVCFLWEPPIIALHIGSNALIAIAFFWISWSLYKLVQKRSDISYSWMIVCFAMVTCLCGVTHIFGIITIFYSEFGLQGAVLLWTGLISILSAWALHHILPFAYKLPSLKQIQDHNRLLEERVGERTQELEKALKEKTFLLAEVHHRVKNNLQVVASLISLRANFVDEEAKPFFIESMERVLAIAKVHKHLQSPTDEGEFRLSTFVKEFSAELHGNGGITCTCDDDTLTIDQEVATPVVLVLHELLTNAYKYGLPGEIKVGITHYKRHVSLHVSNPAASGDIKEGFGLKLIRAMAIQLNGEFDYFYCHEKRLVATLRFPVRVKPDDARGRDGTVDDSRPSEAQHGSAGGTGAEAYGTT